MESIRLKIRGCEFWNLPPIKLTKANPISPIINIGLLNDNQKAVINRSVQLGEILIIEEKSKEFILPEHNASVDDEQEEVEFVSVTVKEEEEQPPEIEPDEQDFEEARILLRRNGNTVKKAILELDKSEESIRMLKACLALEIDGKQRASVLTAIQEKLSDQTT